MELKERLLTYYPQAHTDFLDMYERSKAFRSLQDYQQGDAIEAFLDLFPYYFQRWVNLFSPPKIIDNKYNEYKMFLETFRKNCLYQIIGMVNRKLKGGLQSISESYLSDEDKDNIASIEEIKEERLMTPEQDLLQQCYYIEAVTKMANDFIRYLNTIEKQIFAGTAIERVSVAKLIIQIGPTLSGDLLTPDKVRSIRNLLEYRYICFLSVNGFESDRTMKGMNRHPNLNKRFFGAEKLLEVPETKKLRDIAYGKWEKPKIYKKHDPLQIETRLNEKGINQLERAYATEDYIFRSKQSLNGDKHDRFVLFVNKSGYAIDHTLDSHKPINLFPEDK